MEAGLTVELSQEDDGRWIGDVSSLPGCMVYGKTRDEARNHAIALALRVLADRMENGEAVPELEGFSKVQEEAA